MSLVLEFGNIDGSGEVSALFYINAVTNYTKKVSGKVSKHPLDAGVSISDHFIADNLTFSIRGVITSADITYAAYTTSFAAVGVNNVQMGEPPIAITVDDGSSLLSKFIPDVVGQFLSPVEPEIVGDTSSVSEAGGSFSEFIEKMILSVIYNPSTNSYRNSLVPVSLYEMEGNTYSKAPYSNLIVTDFTVEETPDTGNGCHFTMTLEQSRFVDIRTDKLPEDVNESVKKQAAPTENKGKADSTTKPVDEGTEQSLEKDKGPTTLRKMFDQGVDYLDQGVDYVMGVFN